MGTDRGEEHSLAAGEPGEQAVGSALPAIAAKADDLEEIKKSVEDAASVSGGLWLSYLFVLSYIAIAAGAVTHEDLLLVRAVKLPFLNVELPLKAFFALAPFIVLIIHAYALMHFIMLGKKASRFHNELRRQFPGKEIRDKLRRLLPSNIFVQILAGPPELSAGIFGSMLKLIALTTLVVFPILALLLLQIQFLPFHDVAITWAQRAALFLDIVLLWLLRPPIFADLSVDSSGRVRLFGRTLRGFGLVLAGVTSILVPCFSIVVATIPGEWQEKALARLDRPRWQVTDGFTELVSTHDLLFSGVVDGATRRRKSLFSNTLVLPGFNLYEALKIDDPKKVAWKEHLFDLRARHLEQTVFNGADLSKADLTGAQLQGASLSAAHLQGASLEGAQLQGASLGFAHLEGASLDHAQLQGASLSAAHLQGASLEGAQLQGAPLFSAQLQGASLLSAQLQGAWLDHAELQGASLLYAQLQGASLFGAELQGASLFSAHLQGASLSEAHLQGASLNEARLQGASLDRAELQGTSLSEAHLQGASLSGANVNAAEFSGAYLWRTNWGEIDQAEPRPVRLDAAFKRWKPVKDGRFSRPWDAKAYAGLRESMDSIPKGEMRDKALERIKTLDCGNPDKTLASCDPVAEPPPKVLNWQKKLLKANVDDAAFAKDVATELRSLVCANDTNAIYILRGPSYRLAATGREAPALVDFIMSKDCPVSAALTEDDKANLLRIKQDAEKKSAPPPTSKKEK